MQFFFETFVVIIFLLAAFLLVFLIFLNFYLIKRNGFYVSVNCWFCNGWSKVMYEDRNSFNCPSCSQYNGFKEDGSYNKVIKAQHDTSFIKYSTNKTETYENGLCTYCNNNQQLKVYQLAKFTPINEANYDLEIEHFQKQLDKAYKLCKKCETVLKFTINRQHSWLFGKRLKDLRRKGKSFLNATKPNNIKQENSYFLRLIRLTLVILTIFFLCHILNIRIVYPNVNLNKTKLFDPYKIFLLEIINNFKELKKILESLNMYLPGNIKIRINIFTIVSCIGCFLDLVLSFGQKIHILGKINGQFAWILLIITSSLRFSDHLAFYTFCTKVFTSSALMCNYIWFSPIEPTKKYQFRKISKPRDYPDSSEEETDEEISETFNISSRRISQAVNINNFTAKNVTSTSNLYRSLDNLHLTSLNDKSSQRCASPIYSVKRPILSPSKFKNITQNPWTAGGFWKNNVNVLSAAIDSTNLSRSSSQSSGFVSNHENMNNNPFSSLPPSRETSINGEVDRVSILSEPAYHFSPVKNPVLYYKADNNTFYPVLSQDNMLFIQNGIAHQSFSSSFDSGGKNLFSSLSSEKPISPLFKNLQSNGSFRKAQF